MRRTAPVPSRLAVADDIGLGPLGGGGVLLARNVIAFRPWLQADEERFAVKSYLDWPRDYAPKRGSRPV